MSEPLERIVAFSNGRWEREVMSLHGDMPHAEYIHADLVPQWQPIETAPKDGTKVLLYGPLSCSKGIIRKVPKMAVDRYAQPEDKLGWTGWGKFNPKFWPPTHWQPLPEPPR